MTKVEKCGIINIEKEREMVEWKERLLLRRSLSRRFEERKSAAKEQTKPSRKKLAALEIEKKKKMTFIERGF